jgi:hypothetical protein
VKVFSDTPPTNTLIVSASFIPLFRFQAKLPS